MRIEVLVVMVKHPDGEINRTVIEDMSEKVCFGAHDSQGFRVWFEDEAYFVESFIHTRTTSKAKIQKITIDVPDDF